jgi:hypothetical protein
MEIDAADAPSSASVDPKKRGNLEKHFFIRCTQGLGFTSDFDCQKTATEKADIYHSLANIQEHRRLSELGENTAINRKE